MHEWAVALKPDGSWAGQVRLHAADYEAALRLHGELRGTLLWTGVSLCHTVVASPLLPTMRLGGQTVWASERPARG